MSPLDVSDLQLPVDLAVQGAPPNTIAWNESLTVRLAYAPYEPGTWAGDLVVRSTDPNAPSSRVPTTLEARDLDVDVRVLGEPPKVPLGVSFIVVVTPRPGV